MSRHPRATARRRTILWAPWRAALFSAPKFEGCIFCVLPRSPKRRENLVLEVTRDAVVMLNLYPYASGHLMVAPRRHVAGVAKLSRAQYAALGEKVRDTAAAVRAELRPDGINIGMNVGAAAGAGIADHVHWHLVPRWIGDSNFMTSIADTRVMPEHLLAIYDRFLPHFTTRRLPKRTR